MNIAQTLTIRFLEFIKKYLENPLISLYNPTAMLLIRLLLFLLGFSIVAATLLSAVRTFVLPRSAPDRLTRLVFIVVRFFFNLRMRFADTYLQRDRIMAFYAPISLLFLLPTWLTLIMAGFSCMYRALDFSPWDNVFRLSGSSLLTLGVSSSPGFISTLLSYFEATIGLILVALLIAYLPTMYSAFSRREVAVTLLEVRAGNPPSIVPMLERFHRIHGLENLNEQWRVWEAWFADIEESHTSLPALVFFRSPHPDHSWVTAAGAILDTASFTLSALEITYDPQAALCIRAGFLALRQIADYFNFPYNHDPHFPTDPISVSRAEFDAVWQQLAASGLPLKPDIEQAWLDFAGWRVNYDYVLVRLAGFTMAPVAPWSGDRPITPKPPPLFEMKHGNHP
jgi:hypothetical protein